MPYNYTEEIIADESYKSEYHNRDIYATIGKKEYKIIKKRQLDEAKKIEQPTGASIEAINAMLGQLKADISTEINGIKNMVGAVIESASKPSEPVKTARGGKTDNA